MALVDKPALAVRSAKENLLVLREVKLAKGRTS